MEKKSSLGDASQAKKLEHKRFETTNNFYLAVSPEYRKTILGNLEFVGMSGKSHREINEPPVDNPNFKRFSYATTKINYSELFLGQTHEQFYKVVDDTLRELNLDPKDLEEKIKKARLRSSREGYEELGEILKPVYEAMIAKGYKRDDLIT